MLDIIRDTKRRDGLVKENIHLVGYVLKSIRCNSIDREDAYQIGCMGLIKAAERYEGNRGVMFSTFATHHIRNAILKELSRNNRFNRDTDLKEPNEMAEIKSKEEDEKPDIVNKMEDITEETLYRIVESGRITEMEAQLIMMRVGMGHYKFQLGTQQIASIIGETKMSVSLKLRNIFYRLRKTR